MASIALSYLRKAKTLPRDNNINRRRASMSELRSALRAPPALPVGIYRMDDDTIADINEFLVSMALEVSIAPEPPRTPARDAAAAHQSGPRTHGNVPASPASNSLAAASAKRAGGSESAVGSGCGSPFTENYHKILKVLGLDVESNTVQLKENTVFAEDLVLVLPCVRAFTQMKNLTYLNLSNQGLGPSGATALADGLMELNADTLTAIDLSENSIGFAGRRALNLPNNHPVTRGIAAITTLISRFELLTFLDISSNTLCAAGGRVLASALDEHSALTWLDLSNNMFGSPHVFTTTEVDASGLVAIFAALKTVATLTELNISENAEGAYATTFKGWRKLPGRYNTWEHEDGRKQYTAPAGLISESAESLSHVLSQREALTALKFGTSGELCSRTLAPFRLSTPANLYKIDICSEYFGCSGAVILKAWLAQHGALVETLRIQESQLLSAESGKVLSLILKQNTRITDLQLSNTNTGDREPYEADRHLFVKELCEGMGMLQRLNLSNNDLDVYCATYLADALQQNHILTVLDISQNKLAECSQGFPDTTGVSHLANAIATMSALTLLDMSHNRLYVDGGKAIIPGLKNNTVITELYLENNRLTFVKPSDAKTYFPDKSGGVSELLDAIETMINLILFDLTYNSISIEQFKEFKPFPRPLFPRKGPPRKVAKPRRIPECCNCQRDVFLEEDITFMSECLHMVCPTCLDNLVDCRCPVCHKVHFCDE